MSAPPRIRDVIGIARSKLFTLLWVVAIGLVTLRPTLGQPDTSVFCIACGGRGVADALLNVLLFVPLGVLLVRVGTAALQAVVLSGAFSLLIEFAQLWIPGRDPSAGDLVFNTIGATLGAAMTFHLSCPASLAAAQRRCLAGLFGVAAVSILAVGSWLLGSAYPRPPYWSQWTPGFGASPQYAGRVLDARLGDRELPSGRLPEEVKEELVRGLPLRITFRFARTRGDAAPIFGIADEQPRTVRRISAAGPDALIEEHIRASGFRLDQPAHRFPRTFSGLRPGAVVTMTLQRVHDEVCLEVDGRPDCLRFHLHDTWRLLHAANSWPIGFMWLTAVLWLALLFAPAGALLEPPLERVLVTGAVFVALLFIAAVTSVGASIPDFCAVAAGLWAPALLSGRRTRSLHF